MKRLFLLISFVIVCCWAKAQMVRPIGPPPQQGQNIEALKVAFISRELNLTPEEAERFWPLYNQYTQELRMAFMNNPNVIDRDEHVLNVRKRYNEQFIRIIGPQRTNDMFGAEARFRELLIRAMRRQQRVQNRPNRLIYR